jgi:release factor glutamine methyltransferase
VSALQARPSVRALLERAVSRLAAAGVDTPRADAEWLLADLLGEDRRTSLWLRAPEPVTGEIAVAFERRLARRVAREPLQQIVGWTDFRGLRIRVTADVLVPRPETELLVEWALDSLPARSRGRRLAVDLGTGSGAIACALAYARPDIAVIAVDVSEAAARVARDNVRDLGLADRVWVAVADVGTAFRPLQADLVVANPPYLTGATLAALPPEIRDHEPRRALDGGPDGLDLVRRIVRAAPAMVGPGGRLWLEVGGEDQAAAVKRLLARAPGLWPSVVVGSDLTGRDRFIGAERAGRTTRRGRPVEARRDDGASSAGSARATCSGGSRPFGRASPGSEGAVEAPFDDFREV